MQLCINPDQSIEALMTMLVGWLGDVLPGTTPAHLSLTGTASPDHGATSRLIGIALGTRRVDPAPLHLSCDVLVTMTDADPRREFTRSRAYS